MSESTCSCCGTDTDRTGGRTADRHDERTDGGAPTADGEPTSVLERPMPGELGELAAIAFGLETPTATLGDWRDGLRTWARSQDVWPPGFEDLCHAGDSGHVLEFDGETHHFACVVDPMIVPGILDREELVVRSTSPVDGAEIEIRIEGDEVEVTPSTAVLSLGVSRSIERLDGDEFAPEEAYVGLCAYGNAFPNRTTYEAWDAETPEAATMAIPMGGGVELARALVA